MKPVSFFLEMYNNALTELSKHIREADRDHEFYEGEQWDERDVRELESRGQPVLTLNFIKPTIDVVIGMETKVRADVRIIPRGMEDQALADGLTAAIKFEYERNQVEMAFRQAFEDMIKGGIGWVVVEPNQNPYKDSELNIEYVPYFEMLYDPYSIRPDLMDARYVIRWKWVTSAEAFRRWPEFARRIMSSPDVGVNPPSDIGTTETIIHTALPPDILGSVLDWKSPEGFTLYDKGRDRVAVLEIQYRDVKRDNAVINPLTGEAVLFTQGGDQRIMEGWRIGESMNVPVIREALVVGNQVLYDQEADPAHGYMFKFVPFFAYRKRKGGFFGLVRQMRDEQIDLNKRAIKALHILNTVRVIAEEGAFGDMSPDEVRQEIARPDCMVILARDALAGNRFQVNQDTSMAHQQMLIAQQRRQEIQEVTGVNMEMVGAESKTVSGRAILARQTQGSTIIAPLFDNYRMGRLRAAELVARWVTRLYQPGMIVRLTDDYNRMSNIVLGDLSSFKYDVVVGESPIMESAKQTYAYELAELMRQVPPDMIPILFRAWIRLVDVPFKDEIVEEMQAYAERNAVMGEADMRMRAAHLQSNLQNQGLDRLKKAVEIFRGKTPSTQENMPTGGTL